MTVTYVQAQHPTAGAVPIDTDIATHPRGSDGAEMQDVYIGSDFYAEVAKGNISGHSLIHKFGANAGVTSTLAPVALSGTYQTPTTAQALEFVSSDADDTAAGAGAREITIVGLDANWAEVTQTIATNGLTAVPLPTNLTRLYRWFVSASGTYATASTASHQGTLTIRAASAGATWSQITVAPFPMGQSQIACNTVPTGKTAYLLSVDLFVDALKPCDVVLFQRSNIDTVSAPFSAMRLISQWAGVTGSLHYQPNTPRLLGAGPRDIGLMAKTATTGTITAEYELLLVDV